MRTAFPVQELQVRSALTVAANCVNRTRKHAASVTAYSVLRACPSIQCSTRSLHRQATGDVGNEKLPEPLSCEERGGCRGHKKIRKKCQMRSYNHESVNPVFQAPKNFHENEFQ